jgi:hypothetical protein
MPPASSKKTTSQNPIQGPPRTLEEITASVEKRFSVKVGEVIDVDNDDDNGNEPKTPEHLWVGQL